MHLKSVLYVSTALKSFTPKELEDLEAIAYSNNLMLNLSGYLYFAKGTFVQYIEGPEENLDALFSRICSDDRHTVVRWISEEDIENRRFPNWSMRMLRTNDLVQINLETLLIDQIKIMRDFHVDEPDFSKMAFRVVDKLATSRAAIPLAGEHSRAG